MTTLQNRIKTDLKFLKCHIRAHCGQNWKKWGAREHAPGTPEVFLRNTQGKQLSIRCLDSVLSHMFGKNCSIFQYFPSSACSIELWCPIVHKHWVHITQWLKEYKPFASKTQEQDDHTVLLPERLSTFFSSDCGNPLWHWKQFEKGYIRKLFSQLPCDTEYI